MKSYRAKIGEVVMFGLVLGPIFFVLTAINTRSVWGQSAVIIEGRTTGGVTKAVQVDASGVVATSASVTVGSVSISGIPAVTVSPAAFIAPFSTVNVTNAGTIQLSAANTSRKVLFIQNNSTTYDIYVGMASPVSSTSGFTLPAKASFYASNPAPTNAFYALGTSSVSAVTQVGEGQ